MSITPRVSVIMPIHNRENLVGKAIESIRAQTYEDWELIVVDDGSTDSTREVVDSLANRDSRIQLLTVPKQSTIPAVRNIGLHAVKGELIATMDSDDISDPKRLELLTNFLEQNQDIAAVSSWAREINDKGDEIALTRTSTHPFDLLIETPLCDPLINAASIVRKSALDDIGGYDESYALSYDSRLWVMLALKGYRFVAIPQFLYTICWHGGNVSHNRNESNRYARLAYASFWRITEQEYLGRALRWIDESLSSLKNCDLFIWGTGRAAELFVEYTHSCSDFHLKGLIDSNHALQGTTRWGLRINSPENIDYLQCERIAIASRPGQFEIADFLTHRGFDRERGDFMPVARLMIVHEKLLLEG